MLTERLEGKWIDAFVHAFALCKIGRGTTVAILSETLSRLVNVELAEIALQRLDARPFHVRLPTPAQEAPVAVRSTGSSFAVQALEPAVRALESAEVVIDCTVEGMLHAKELPRILKGGTRLYMISNEHPEVLERLLPDAAIQPRIELAKQWLGAAREMRVTSAAGTDLTIKVAGAPVRGAPGFVDEPGKLGYWPGGLVLCFPKANTVNGTLVLDVGDVNLTFKRYLEAPIHLTIENDYVTRIDGTSLDARLMRSYFEAWQERDAYGVSHVGWGMNARARWDALQMYDKHDINGTELRAFAGNFLYSTGANEHAGRFTRGHFDLPVCNCTVALDGKVVVSEGRLCAALA
jgi:2,5-dihydroxypyridine 5,6-dioxygenase